MAREHNDVLQTTVIVRTTLAAPTQTSTDNAETWLQQLRHLATIIGIIIINIISSPQRLSAVAGKLRRMAPLRGPIYTEASTRSFAASATTY